MNISGKIFASIMVLLINTAWHFLYYHADKNEYFHYLSTTGFHIEFITFASSLVLALWAGHQFDRATFFSQKDPLTTLYNRRYVDDKIPKVLEASRRRNMEVSLLVIDVNHFKKINDTHGHKFGDTVLQKVAVTLGHHTRKKDIACRWGGDEFILILMNTGGAEAEAVAEKIMQESTVSLSVGYSLFPQDGKNLDELIKKADDRMYKFKRL